MAAAALGLWELQRGGKVLESATSVLAMSNHFRRQLKMKCFSPVWLTLSSVFSSEFSELLLGFLNINPHSQMQLCILVVASQQITVL